LPFLVNSNALLSLRHETDSAPPRTEVGASRVKC
jgi:hypothetical protein